MNSLQLPTDPQTAKHVLDAEHKRRELEIECGLLGKLFGTSPRVSIYIAGVLVILCAIVGLIFPFLPPSSRGEVSTADFWKIVSPTITTCLAYIFGASSKNEKGA
jgi:hypothetical protein